MRRLLVIVGRNQRERERGLKKRATEAVFFVKAVGVFVHRGMGSAASRAHVKPSKAPPPRHKKKRKKVCVCVCVCSPLSVVLLVRAVANTLEKLGMLRSGHFTGI